MTDPLHHSFDDQDWTDEPIPSRYYKVAIAVDTTTARMVIPSEAEPGAGRRYQCYVCRQFVHLCARRHDELRPRELWYFKDAPKEAVNCGGESYDHAIATAVASWLLTRHVEHDTTVSCTHTCARCERAFTVEVPREGLRLSLGHSYQGTPWKCDAALISGDDAPHWGLEIFHTHAVNRDKAQGIPCPWAEVVADEFKAIIADKNRYAQRVVTLVAQQGRPDQIPVLPTGRWFCDDCRLLPPPIPVPPSGEYPPIPKADYGKAEASRRAVVGAFAEQLRCASAGSPVIMHHPLRCTKHDIPLVSLTGDHWAIRHVETPRQTTKALTWDLVAEARLGNDPHGAWQRIGMLILGKVSHPVERDGTLCPPSSFPFLVVDQRSVQNKILTILWADHLPLATTCLACREEERRTDFVLVTSPRRDSMAYLMIAFSPSRITPVPSFLTCTTRFATSRNEVLALWCEP